MNICKIRVYHFMSNRVVCSQFQIEELSHNFRTRAETSFMKWTLHAILIRNTFISCISFFNTPSLIDGFMQVCSNNLVCVFYSFGFWLNKVNFSWRWQNTHWLMFHLSHKTNKCSTANMSTVNKINQIKKINYSVGLLPHKIHHDNEFICERNSLKWLWSKEVS